MVPVLDLLMTDETNPRLVGFSANRYWKSTSSNLPRDQDDPLLNIDERIMLTAQTGLRLADIESLKMADRDGMRRHLDRLISRLALQLRNLSDSITHKYLVHAGTPRQMTEIRPIR